MSFWFALLFFNIFIDVDVTMVTMMFNQKKTFRTSSEKVRNNEARKKLEADVHDYAAGNGRLHAEK